MCTGCIGSVLLAIARQREPTLVGVLLAFEEPDCLIRIFSMSNKVPNYSNDGILSYEDGVF